MEILTGMYIAKEIDTYLQRHMHEFMGLWIRKVQREMIIDRHVMY